MFALPAAFAAHPLQTEDTGTQGAGNVEIENGFSRARFDSTTLTVYQPQVSVGLAATVDAIVQPSAVWLHAPGRPAASGPGDTNVDGKWRFWGSDPWSFAVRAGLLAPTSRDGLGLQHGDVSEHALLVATWDDAPTTVHANLGLTRVPRAPGTRVTVVQASAAVMQQVGERLILTADGEVDQDPDPSRKSWPGSLLGGIIWTARPGLDVDVGWQRSFGAQPINRQWMAGLTWRFAL
ncbi:MAG: transporter [Vitreoscilla sp.]